jgi:hypothetical protein
MPTSRNRKAHKAKSARYSNELRQSRQQAQRKELLARLNQHRQHTISALVGGDSQERTGYASQAGTQVSDANPYTQLAG